MNMQYNPNNINKIMEKAFHLFRQLAKNLQFLGVGISTLSISGFFYRYAHEYRMTYITAQQHFTLPSILITIFPIIFSMVGALFSENAQFYYGIATISSILSVFYPLLLHSKIVALGSLFPLSLLGSCLIIDFPITITILYVLAMISLVYFQFDHESEKVIKIYQYVACFLLLDLIGIPIENELHDNLKDPEILCTYSGFIGAFIGFLMEKIL
ncbi:hypothetical protein TVAG_305570 [Trichomonas vaginalis G3]|uniref:Uncharacterized protein n=1 Tax=Trichomonas vaginalis (strain ATCC PRA-98 / G3) TaxID=412133 RepID=A2ERD1_TRIV3|nr:hypothetical protein TVAGG3_1004060 [Trichomonas vaginalis G3]EAY04807.1 hypothetical protein TVAG_305570 [Trichomonas vaginalis G3]KAI5491008.1 hypothetical protein TVAGG3_1004060 [Trichomonas vaginalis G3]|eukprot:XP_001317030.1 hypothetical protein [Trichomonas vaginalis G3]